VSAPRRIAVLNTLDMEVLLIPVACPSHDLDGEE